MSSNNSFSPFILLFLLLLLIIDSADLSVSSSCPSDCGGIKIPFPFGVGEGCYLEKWYEIECVNTSISGKCVPFLTVISKEVVNIFLPEILVDYSQIMGKVRIKNQITSKGCSSDGGEVGSLLNLTDTPFYISQRNTLIVVGCNNTATLTHVKPNMVGCKSSCSEEEYRTPTKDYLAAYTCKNTYGYANESCNKRSTMYESGCHGIGCCQADMPSTIQQIVGVRIDNTTTTGGCTVAFLTDEKYFLSDPKQLHAKQNKTIELGWLIHTTNISFVKSLECQTIKEYNSYSTRENTRDRCACDYNANLSYASCACLQGFKGNPYRLGGCKG